MGTTFYLVVTRKKKCKENSARPRVGLTAGVCLQFERTKINTAVWMSAGILFLKVGASNAKLWLKCSDRQTV